MGPEGPGLTRAEVQAMIDAAIVDMVRYGRDVSLQAYGDPTEDPKREGSFLSADEGGPPTNQPFRLIGRPLVGPWETWVLKRGQYGN